MLSSAHFVDYETWSEPTATQHTARSSILFIPPNLHTQFPGSIELRSQVTRREDLVHEGTDQRAQQVLGWATDAEDFAVAAGRNEGHALAAVYLTKRVRHRTDSFTNTVRIAGVAEPETSFCYQGTTAEHDYAAG